MNRMERPARLDEILDTDRYPIDDMDSEAARRLAARCRSELAATALSTLPEFLRPNALTRIAEESLSLAPQALRRDRLRTPYSWLDNRGFPSDHPRSALTVMRQGTITRAMLGGCSLLLQLFSRTELTTFVRRAIGIDVLYPSADPYLSVTINVLGSGDAIGWHFDANDIVVGLMLAQADKGGMYEYVPYLRDAADENYRSVGQVFSGDRVLVRQPEIAPGTLYLFNGHRSAHRVTEVGRSAVPRLSAIFCYDEEPGQVISEATHADVFSSSGEPFLGTQR